MIEDLNSDSVDITMIGDILVFAKQSIDDPHCNKLQWIDILLWDL